MPGGTPAPAPGPGMKFKPTDGELFGYILYNHIHGKLPSSYYSTIPRLDAYADEPWKIWSNHQSSYEPGDVYVFTNSGNCDRKIGTDGGNWQSQDSETEYKCVLPSLEKDERWIGTLKRFNYNNPNPNFASENGKWVLHEFSLRKEGGEDFDEVACLIRNNGSPTGNAMEAAARARRSVLVRKHGFGINGLDLRVLLLKSEFKLTKKEDCEKLIILMNDHFPTSTSSHSAAAYLF